MLVFPFGVISVSRCSSCPFFLQVRPLIVRSFCKSVLLLSVLSASPSSSGRLFRQTEKLTHRGVLCPLKHRPKGTVLAVLAHIQHRPFRAVRVRRGVLVFPFDEKTGDRSKARHAWGALIQSRTTNLWHVCNVFFCEYTHFYSIIKCLYFATRLIYPHPLVYKIKYMAKCMKFVGRCIKFVVTCFKNVGIYNKDSISKIKKAVRYGSSGICSER